MRKRTGTFIMLAGIALAFVAGLMVLAITRQAAAQSTAQVKQVLVVMAARDIPDGTPVSADALTVQAFPEGFVPEGAIPAPEQAVGKYTVTQITKGQIILVSQLSVNKRAGEVAKSVPAGKVAVALPMTDLMSTAGALKAGDHVDILLTLNLKEVTANGQPAPGGSGDKNIVTQTTLQNVEILSVGQVDAAAGNSNSGSGPASGVRQTAVIIVLLDHQDALVLKYAKDSGGVVDLALRAPDDTLQVKTETVTIDLMFERFNYRRPAPVP
jgi:pilus assembly protein CpaB